MNDPMSPADFYKLIRSQIEHEDNLNSQRLSWFVASQSFLFTAYAIVLSNLTPGKLPSIQRQLDRLMQAIPIVALLTCVLIFATIIAGAIAMSNLRRMYTAHERSAADTLPPVQGYRLTQRFGQAGPLGLPPVFIVVWLYLLTQGIVPW